MGEIVVECDLAGDRVLFVIRRGCTLVHLTPARRGPRYICERRGELGFTRVAVSDDSQIPEMLSSESFHGRQDLLNGWIPACEPLRFRASEGGTVSGRGPDGPGCGQRASVGEY